MSNKIDIGEVILISTAAVMTLLCFILLFILPTKTNKNKVEYKKIDNGAQIIYSIEKETGEVKDFIIIKKDGTVEAIK